MGQTFQTALNNLNIERDKRIFEVQKYYETQLNQLVVKHCKYKIGQYLKSVIGIIKVDEVGYDRFGFYYKGFRYWYSKDKIVRTKSKEKNRLYEYAISHILLVENDLLIDTISTKDD